MQNDMRKIGVVTRVQVQREPLKRELDGLRIFDPSAIEAVEALRITTDGVIGLCRDGEQVLDAHHAAHPHTRNKGHNAISLGFSAHYEKMRAMFGPHMADGVAGENIIVGCEKAYDLEDLSGELVFENPEELGKVVFRVSKAMAPCDEFSHFSAQAEGRLSPEKLKQALQFLSDGRRGFTLEILDPDPSLIHLGARVFLKVDPGQA